MTWPRLWRRAARSPSRLDDAPAVLFAALGLVVAAGLEFGPTTWRSSPSMHYAAESRIPWGVFAGAWAVYALLLLVRTTRVGTFAVGGLVLWGYFAGSVLVAAYHHGLTNVVGGAALIAVAAVQPLCARWAAITETWRTRL